MDLGNTSKSQYSICLLKHRQRLQHSSIASKVCANLSIHGRPALLGREMRENGYGVGRGEMGRGWDGKREGKLLSGC